jgi:hypothetical protein
MASRHKVELPGALMMRSLDYAIDVVKGYRLGRNPASLAVSSRGADQDIKLQTLGRMAECAFAIDVGLDPLTVLNWGERCDNGFDCVVNGRRGLAFGSERTFSCISERASTEARFPRHSDEDSCGVKCARSKCEGRPEMKRLMVIGMLIMMAPSPSLAAKNLLFGTTNGKHYNNVIVTVRSPPPPPSAAVVKKK